MNVDGSSIVRFGPFELRVGTGELSKSGRKIRLQGQALRILICLLEAPGWFVSREDLRRELWPDGTFGDFDHSLNVAVNRLRERLGDTSENSRYIQTVPGAGYRFVGPIENGDSPQSTPLIGKSEISAEVIPAVPIQEIRHSSPMKRFLLSTAAGLLGGVLVFGTIFALNLGGARQWMRRQTNPTVHSLAVLPLENFSGDVQQEYFADGMTDELITDLAQFQNLHVISRTSVMHYKGTKKPLPQIAHELKVDAILEGSVVRSGQRMRIAAQLIEARNDRHIWAGSYDRDVADVLALQREMSLSIANEIRLKVVAQQAAPSAGYSHVDPQVEENYLKARYHLNKGSEEEIHRGIQLFQQVLVANPKDARAYAGLADSYLALSDWYAPPADIFTAAKSASRSALDLDPTLAEAHTSSGVIRFLLDWDWAGAETEFKRAIELNPSSVDAHIWYAAFLAQMERSDQAVSEQKRAEALDPLSLSVFVNGGWVYYVLRQNDRAVEEWRKVIDLEPNFVMSHSAIWAAYLGPATLADRVALLRKAVSTANDPLALAALGPYAASCGEKAQARAIVSELEAISKHRYVCPYEIATLHAVLGDKEEAMAYLSKGYRERSECIPNIKTDPRLDSLRSDQRFQELMQKVGFGP